MRILTPIVVSIACLAVTGCVPKADSNSGPVAVVDLDAIAQKLGKDKQILQMIEQRQVNLNDQVIAAQQSLIQQLNQRKAEFGEVSDVEAKELAELQNKANAILSSTRAQAQTNLTNFQQETIDRFRADIKPIAMELATKKGCRVVLSKNDSVVFAFDQTVDLTEEVIAVMQSKVASSSSAKSLGATNASVKQASAVAPSSMKR